jgi:hypothetical protein
MSKKLAIGCGIGCGVLLLLGLLLALGLLSVCREYAKDYTARMDGTYHRKEYDKKATRLAADWRPLPENVDLKRLFPLQVDDYQRSEVKQNVKLSELNIQRGGRYAHYILPQNLRQSTMNISRKIDVYAYPVTQAESEALFARIEQAYKKAGATNIESNAGYSNAYRRGYFIAEQGKHSHVWYLKGWLFVFRIDHGTDFDTLYLKAVGIKPGADNTLYP